MIKHLSRARVVALASLIAATGVVVPVVSAGAHAQPTVHAAKKHRPHHRHHVRHRIPQHNGGDHDFDNNGGPSDGDGNV